MKKIRFLTVLMTTVLVLACLGGCGNTDTGSAVTQGGAAVNAGGAPTNSGAKESVTITFWHTYGDAEEKAFLEEVLPLWEKAHPEIKVEAVRQDGSQYHEMIVTSFGTGMSCIAA